jgi:tryptophan synthase alpha chain
VIDAGADVLEIGMPFSDPVADGPTIQKADERAIAAGMTPDLLFDMIREIREYSDIPLVLLTYCNSVYARGVERFYQEAASAGLDGILVVDMPLEESDPVVRIARRVGIDPIFLIAETTSDRRLGHILSRAGGFLYLVSTLGVTGVREELSPEVEALIARVKKMTELPVAVGFGISRPDQMKSLHAAGADAVIVGSAIVQRVEEQLRQKEKGWLRVGDYIRKMKGAIRTEK